MPETSSSGHRRLVLFDLNAQRFGFRIDNLVEIGTVGTARPASDLPGYISGITLSRGREVPILDLRAILGLPARRLSPSTPLIVMRVGAQAIGLAVDTVSNIHAAPGTWHPFPAGAVPEDRNPYTAVTRVDDDLLLILDEQRLLPIARAVKEAA